MYIIYIGESWTAYNISQWSDNQVCPACGSDFLTGSSALAIGPDDTVFYLYNGDDNTTEEKETRIMFTRMQAEESSFSAAVDVSDAPRGGGVYQGFVLIAAGSDAADAGPCRAGWTGADA